MKVFTVSQSFDIGDSTIAIIHGDTAPVVGEDFTIDGKTWSCSRVDVRSKGWKVRMRKSGENIDTVVQSTLDTLHRMRQRNLDAQEKVKAYLTGRQARNCEHHESKMEFNYVEMVKAVMAGNEPKDIYLPCRLCGEADGSQQEAYRLIGLGVPKNMTHAKLSNFKPRNEGEKQLIAAVRAFHGQRSGFLCMIGEDKGVGKTHCGIGLLREYRTARMLTQQELLNGLRATYRDDRAEDITAACKRVDCLVLDEMGLSGGGRDEFPMIHDILSSRYNGNKTTVLIGNFPKKEELYALIGERMTDRLRECGYAVLHFAGQSQRTRKQQDFDGMVPPGETQTNQ